MHSAAVAQCSPLHCGRRQRLAPSAENARSEPPRCVLRPSPDRSQEPRPHLPAVDLEAGLFVDQQGRREDGDKVAQRDAVPPDRLSARGMGSARWRMGEGERGRGCEDTGCEQEQESPTDECSSSSEAALCAPLFDPHLAPPEGQAVLYHLPGSRHALLPDFEVGKSVEDVFGGEHAVGTHVEEAAGK